MDDATKDRVSNLQMMKLAVYPDSFGRRFAFKGVEEQEESLSKYWDLEGLTEIREVPVSLFKDSSIVKEAIQSKCG